MLKNYLVSAFRNLKKYPVNSVINITGLAIGITFFVLLMTYIRDELTYDHFHPKADNIYMLTASLHNGTPSVSSSPILAQVLSSEYPGIEQTIRFWKSDLPVLRGENINIQDVGFADPGIFDLLAFTLQQGDAAQAIDTLSKVVSTYPYYGTKIFRRYESPGANVKHTPWSRET